ncbi:hypothetical protein PybrP1_002256 [[Pythium] brassicae (nom. inval.)]|nr:hypothetical protein PybrP1_002256 [[Pythium] brassicae (nom. inval.)]
MQAASTPSSGRSAFPSDSVHLFAVVTPENNALVIDLSAPFGWAKSPGEYEIFGCVVSYMHGRSSNEQSPHGFFSYHWVDNHVDVAVDDGSNCNDVVFSLRSAMVTVFGGGTINENKFTQ